jgi:Transcription factor WhiB.
MSVVESPAQSWWKDAACQSRYDIPTFFPNEKDLKQTKKLKAVCNSCPVQAECFAYAYVHGEKDGIWGGAFYRERILMVTLLRVPRPISEASLAAYLHEFWDEDTDAT